jgi:hypothetical protein
LVENLPMPLSPAATESLAGATSRPSLVEIAGCCAFVGCYLAIVGWFKWVDVYHAHFAVGGALVVTYNFFRVLFAFYLFWLISAPGAVLLRAFARAQGKASFALSAADAVPLNFFAGTGIWHLVLLAFGYLNLYTVPVALCLTVPAAAVSFFEFAAAVRSVGSWFKTINQATPAFRLAQWLFLVVAIAAAAVLLAAKGLYPGGGNDYFEHYFRFYQSVIDHRGVWPNEIWYQYFYSKGAGLYFLSMLLTDPLAPQLVTFCFMIAAGLVLLRFIDRFSPGSLWPWVGIVLLFSIYVYTPGRGEFRGNGGWADFEKLHELNASLVIAILWMLSNALNDNSEKARPWIAGTASTVIAAVLINTQIAIYLGATLCMLTIWFLFRGNSSRAMLCFAVAAVAGVLFAASLALNYATTGLASDQPLSLFLPFANVERLYRWGALALAILVFEGAKAMAQYSEAFLSFSFLWQALHFLRAYILFPLFAGGLALGTAAFARLWADRRRSDLRRLAVPIVVSAAGMAAFGLLAAAGRTQHISFFRYSSFIVPVLIVIGTALWAVSLDQLVASPGRRRAFTAALAPIAVVSVWASTIVTFQDPQMFRTNLANSWAFVSGTFSIDRAYTMQSFPGRFPWGAIYPGARGALEVVGPRAVIWSFHSTAFCMLPDCYVASYPAFLMGQDWDRIMFGTPEEAKNALQRAGINYFLFSKELRSGDPLMKAPLFNSESISRYLGIRWSDGTSALLTWRDPDTLPFDENWLQAYRRTAATAAPVENLKGVFAQLHATPHPWRRVKLP